MLEKGQTQAIYMNKLVSVNLRWFGVLIIIITVMSCCYRRMKLRTIPTWTTGRRVIVDDYDAIGTLDYHILTALHQELNGKEHQGWTLIGKISQLTNKATSLILSKAKAEASCL